MLMIKEKKKKQNQGNVRIYKLHTWDNEERETKRISVSSLNLIKLGFKLVFQLAK